MNKLNFVLSLHEKLSGMPENEIEERLNFYCEMIEDRIEEGLSEEEAVAEIGNIDDIAEQIIADIPLTKIVKHKVKNKKRKLRAWEIVLLAVGSPLWFVLLCAALVVILALYISIWAMVVSLWAVDLALAVCLLGSIFGLVLCAIGGNVFAGLAMLGAGIVCAGLSIFLFFGCLKATVGTVWLLKKFIFLIKKCFRRKEEA